MKFSAVVLFSLAIIACNRVPLTMSGTDLRAYCAAPEHGLVQTVQADGNWQLSLEHQPVDLIAARMGNKGGVDQKTLDSLRAILNKNQYYVLRISNRKRGVIEELKTRFADRFDSLWTCILFDQTHNFSIESGGKIYPCVFYQVENRGNIDPALVIDLTFAASPEADQDVVWQDSIFTRTVQRFHFAGSDLSQTPTLKTINSN